MIPYSINLNTAVWSDFIAVLFFNRSNNIVPFFTENSHKYNNIANIPDQIECYISNIDENYENINRYDGFGINNSYAYSVSLKENQSINIFTKNISIAKRLNYYQLDSSHDQLGPTGYSFTISFWFLTKMYRKRRTMFDI